MKKIIQKEVILCDVCGAEVPYADTCLCCGTEHCHSCARTHGKEYRHGVYMMGSGDGYYCNICEPVLTAGNDPLLLAYKHIGELRNEEAVFRAGFKLRCEEAEERIVRLQPARRLTSPTDTPAHV